MLDVSRWLAEQGLGHHAKAFAENGIAGDILRDLTDADLRELGLNLGDRKRLLKAIKALAAGPTEVIEEAAKPAATAPREAERRQLTVMFVDLVGSTALAEELDPEEMRAVLTDYQNAVAGVVTRFEGHVAKYMGDGVLAYFGWPRAHEDEAERAVRTGLGVVDGVGRLRGGGGPLAARVGIATGDVVVGDLIGAGAAQEEAVVGATPNLAARLQALAEPGQVVVADATRALVGGGFRLADLGRQHVKGVAEPVPAFAVTGEITAESRFEARAGPRLLPMVGRDQELALLLERWQQAVAGEGQGVMLVGEAGIGKSRIVRALLDDLAGTSYTRIRYQCSPYHADSPLWPVVQQLQRATGFFEDDGADGWLDKLETLLAQTGNGAATAALIAALLGLDASTRYGTLDLTPQTQRAHTLQALVDQLLGLAAHQPVLLVVEDGHWIDPTTLELIEQGLDAIVEAPVLMLLTSRPDGRPELAERPHRTTLTLNRLGRAGVRAIVARLGGGDLPDAAVDTIVARTDGVPLYVEELTKAVLEHGGDDASIPASLHDSLMARLDRAGDAKEVAQAAACIGREFDVPLLAAIADRSTDELALGLRRLVDTELVFRRGSSGNTGYVFKHALVRRAAHESLLKAKRQRLHARLAGVLEEHHPDVAQTDPARLASHWAEAGDTGRSATYRRRAGDLAARSFAYVEAVRHDRAALALLTKLSPSAERDRQMLDILLALGPALMNVAKFSAPEIGETYERARALAQDTGDTARRFTATWGLWLHHQSTPGRAGMAQELATELVALGEKEADADMLLQAHHAAWTTAEHRGDASACLAHSEAGLALYRPDQHHVHALSYGGHDPGVCALFHKAWAVLLLGYPDQALSTAHAAAALARELDHPPSSLIPLFYLAFIHWWRREPELARSAADDVLAFGERHDLQNYRGPAQVMQGWAINAAAGGFDGFDIIERGFDDLDTGGPELRRPDCLLLRAEVLKTAGHIDRALKAVEAARAFETGIGLERLLAETIRFEGELLLLQSSHHIEAAETCYHDSLVLARRWSARAFELRTATSLARLWAGQGERQKAYDLLFPVFEGFTEGFDTADLKDAKALLRELV